MERDARTHGIIGAAMEVHRIIGPGHLEAVYHECLEIEFGELSMSFLSKPNPGKPEQATGRGECRNGREAIERPSAPYFPLSGIKKSDHGRIVS